MKKSTQILIILIVLSFRVSAQTSTQAYEVSFQTGVGKYSMGGLKDINRSVMNNIPFKTELVDDFPAYIYYRPSIGLKLGLWCIGINYTFQSTGSRISTQDYSAEYKFDMKVKAHCPGVYVNLNFPTQKKMIFTLHANIGITYTELQTHEYFNLLSVTRVDNNEIFKAQNYYFEPDLSISFPVHFIELSINTGTMFEFGGNAYHLASNSSNILRNPSNGNEILPNWNGIRIGISVTYHFGNIQ